MKIAVIGASGNAGSRIVAELAGRGHNVTAIARHPEKIAQLANVTAKQGDAFDEGAMAKLLAGHDAAISSVHFTASDPEKLIGAVKAGAVGRYLVLAAPAALRWRQAFAWSRRPPFPRNTRRKPRKARPFSTGCGRKGS